MIEKMSGRRTKIVCTLGPSSSTYEVIRGLAKEGMDVARLNFSHGTHEEHKNLIGIIRQVSEEVDKPIGILQDLQGPKIRVGKFEKGKINLKRGNEIILTVKKVKGDENKVSVSYSSFNKDVKSGDAVLLNDGKIKMKVLEVKDKDVKCRVVYGGELSDHKGLNLPGSILSVDALTEKDVSDLKFGLRNGVDFAALSFVQKVEDIHDIKKLIEENGRDAPVVAKIEKPQAVNDIENIIEATDSIMIARGDLGVEMDTAEVPPIQKKIIRLCNEKGVSVITATQMLESMIDSPRPTRAEASDVANAVLDGSDAVMLSGETASGAYPKKAVRTMNHIVSLIEKSYDDRWKFTRREQNEIYPVNISVGYAACQAAVMVNAKAIICLTKSGSTAGMISRFRPSTPIIAMTSTQYGYNRTSLMWGVSAILIRELPEQMNNAVKRMISHLKGKNLVKAGDKLVFTAGQPFYKHGATNVLRIETV
ncbi:pyruvate kinase [candidate division KSB1 bacterium]